MNSRVREQSVRLSHARWFARYRLDRGTRHATGATRGRRSTHDNDCRNSRWESAQGTPPVVAWFRASRAGGRNPASARWFRPQLARTAEWYSAADSQRRAAQPSLQNRPLSPQGTLQEAREEIARHLS